MTTFCAVTFDSRKAALRSVAAHALAERSAACSRGLGYVQGLIRIAPARDCGPPLMRRKHARRLSAAEPPGFASPKKWAPRTAPTVEGGAEPGAAGVRRPLP